MKTWIVLQKRDKNVNYETDRLLVEGGEGTELIYHPNVDIIVDRQDRRSIRVKNQVVDLPNVVIPRTGSGTGYFGHSLLRHFERLGVPLLNNSAAIEVTKDKLHAAQVFAEHHLPTPKTMLVKDPLIPV